MEMRSFGDLTGPFIPPARSGQPSSLIILLHGWGADGNDLADLAYPISVRFPGAAFFVPNGPSPCKMNPTGREWFDIDDRVNGPVAAAPVIDVAKAAALAALNLPASALALIGFSQGGMMSLHCGLRHAAPPAAIVSFSGALLRHDDLGDGVNYPPVLLVHGTDDQVVPFALQSAACDVMKNRSIMVETVACDRLGHGIDADGLSAAIAFLARYLPA
jgi:phospholipase/carboxylesterase